MTHPDVIESGTLLYELVPGDAPTDLVPPILDDSDEECQAYADTSANGVEARDGDVVCSRRAGHDGPHWDGWSRESWELVRP